MGEVSRFWRESVHRYRLVAHQCGNCKRIYFPPRDVCPICHRDSIGKMSEVALSGKGEIVSYTVVHEAPPTFTRQRPYVLAIVKLDEGPSITAQIVDADPGEVEIGKRVRSVFRRIAQEGETGIIEYGYKFVLE
ncbi:MAG TPA: Zn-ribbon domain-containing OB-fold protein [Thermoplasmataceae archaeon]|nr:Zn-ribbon domain-containing OB-fold protein [Thermoplasmatales archaeon AK]HLH86772.1 Zn-ribbon domain-containing OB-fold protein [Thermoplasmataceae archaeon]